MLKMYFIYKVAAKKSRRLYKIELCHLPLRHWLFLSCNCHGVTDRTCKQKSWLKRKRCVREINVSRAWDPVHAGDKALTRETPGKRGRVNRYGAETTMHCKVTCILYKKQAHFSQLFCLQVPIWNSCADEKRREIRMVKVFKWYPVILFSWVTSLPLTTTSRPSLGGENQI
jgi:hypothetical protein